MKAFSRTFIFIVFCLISLGLQAQNTLTIERVYATSTEGEFPLTNLFDGNKETFWATAKGTGLNEGIMIHLTKPEYLSSIKLHFKDGEHFAHFQNIETYVDGHELSSRGTFVPYGQDQVEITINQRLSALFIRFRRLHEVENKDVNYDASSNQGGDNRQFYIEKQQEAFSIGLSDITFYNANGAMDIELPQRVQTTLTASSSLKPETAYGAFRLFDRQTAMAWSEGASGIGVGEHIDIRTEQKIDVTALKIWNGYQRSEKHFEDNARLKAFYFGTSKENAKRYEIAADQQGAQNIQLESPLHADHFYFEVAEAAAGKKYQDLVISELLFMNGDKSINIATQESEALDDTFRNAVQNSPLAQILDQSILLSTGHYGNRLNNSILLRSNGTFVYYKEQANYGSFGDTNSAEFFNIIADGNWEVRSKSEDKCEIRIFGKHRKVSSQTELYLTSGDDVSELTRVFQDYLTITKDQIKGQRFVDTIPLN